ncbi:hypothetical protein MRB53_013178 [Persea americana]|uniref:Uncharacterized protein n=1 Tax=Persea americana TaxID=3435 RepID=A0ACC2K7B7_PERAE|nr:hypothetical protein MRB53_013178 [Persea americana]
MHRLQRGDEDQGGLAYLQLGFPTAPAPTPCLPSGDLEQGGAAPPVEEGSLPAVASRMRTGDLEQGGTPYLASDQACHGSSHGWVGTSELVSSDWMTCEEFEETGLSIGARIQGSSVVGVGRKELEEE